MKVDDVTLCDAMMTYADASYHPKSGQDPPPASDLEQAQSSIASQPSEQLEASRDIRSSRSRKQRRSGPTSLPDHFKRKGYLSVSDLVGPSWCEYNYQYGILSLSHLPPSQRPETITTKSGQSLSASVELVQRKDKVLEAGKAVHTVLERQVAPVQVVVQTETREDAWALRLLNIWCDVQALLRLDPESSTSQKAKGKQKQKACVREVPVYGWLHGVFVMGVIDEIEKRQLKPKPTPSSAASKQAKTWSSQEEWKKEQLLKPKSSPTKKKGAATSSEDTKNKSLMGFFKPSASQATPPSSQSETTPQDSGSNAEASTPGWGYFLSDTKTRISSWLPDEQDQFSARMQCMTYKRLFDGLCLGAVLAEHAGGSVPASILPDAPRKTSPSESVSTRFDSNATPMNWLHTFATQGLDPEVALSDAFLADAVPLCESWGTDLFSFIRSQSEKGASALNGSSSSYCTLNHVRLLLERGLRQLVQDAAQGQHHQGGEHHNLTSTGLAVLQSELALNYRQQQRRPRGSRKRSTKPKPDSSDKTKSSKSALVSQTTLLQPTLDSLLKSSSFKDDNPLNQKDDGDGNVEGVEEVEGENQDSQSSQHTPPPVLPDTDVPDVGAAAVEDVRSSLDAIDGHKEVDLALSQTFLPPTSFSPKKALPSKDGDDDDVAAGTNPKQKNEEDKEQHAALESKVIGVVKFVHSPAQLDKYLRDMLDMWKGKRSLKGVSVTQTRRCWNCEWRNDCEWRSLQSEQHQQKQQDLRNQNTHGSLSSGDAREGVVEVAGQPTDGIAGDSAQRVQDHETNGSTDDDQEGESKQQTLDKDRDQDQEDEFWNDFDYTQLGVVMDSQGNRVLDW